MRSPRKFPLRPALFRALEGYDGPRFLRDLTAGLIVGVVAIPLSLAFAIASGLAPSAGLATVVVAGFLVSALGGSKVQIGGPTGAFVVIVYGIAATHGVDGLALATLMAGGILVLFGLFRLGRVIAFIPHPVITGFTAGIGLIIFLGQLKEILGLRALDLPADAFGKVQMIAAHLGETSPWALGLALVTIVTIVAARRFVPRVPGPVVALVGLTLAAVGFDLPVETIGSRFGDLPAGLPAPALPAFDLERIRVLLPAALTIALLGAIESLLSAVVADGMIEDHHDADQELVGQGIANLLSPLFGGMPATGAIARTATNVQAGGRTPVAGIVHAAVVFLFVTFLTSTLQVIPLCVLGGILCVVAWTMSDIPKLRRIRGMPRADAAVLVATLVLTVAVDLVVAVEVGMVLAAFLFMGRMSQVADVRPLSAEGEPDEDRDRQQPLAGKDVPSDVLVYSIDGPFFFGAAERCLRTVERIERVPPIVILRLRHVPYVDDTGLSTLERIVRGFQRDGATVILSAVQPAPLAAMRRHGLVTLVGEPNVQPTIDAALTRARVLRAAAGAES